MPLASEPQTTRKPGSMGKRGYTISPKRAKKPGPAKSDTIAAAPARVTAHGQRIKSVLEAVAAAGLTRGATNKRISSRAHERLFAAAAEKTGLAGDSELIEYALAKVVLEDDFAERLLALKGSIDQDIDLEF